MSIEGVVEFDIEFRAEVKIVRSVGIALPSRTSDRSAVAALYNLFRQCTDRALSIRSRS